jgi:hypothetical protein
MTDSPDTTNPSSAGDDAELLALGLQIESFISQHKAFYAVEDEIKLAVERTVASLPVEEQFEARAQAEKAARIAFGVRHPDYISSSMYAPSLKIMGLPAFTAGGLRVKARLAEFNCSHFWDESDRACNWDELCARKLVESVLRFDPVVLRMEE